MTITQNWTEKNYLNHIIRNKLDYIWYRYCNPKSVEGIRTAAYTPIYSDKLAEMIERKCTRKGCDGTLLVPLDDRLNKVIYKLVCNGTVNGSACGGYKAILYRWVDRTDKTKLWFNHVNTVRHYGSKGRTFYGTLSIYDRRIVRSGETYVNESLIRAHTLGIDIDIKRGMGTICDSVNRDEMSKALDIVREELSTFVDRSYNVQTSGNGVYVLLHHDLVKVDIFNVMGRFNSWIRYMNNVLKDNGVTRIKIDPINMPSRVFKLVGSIHQKYDLVCIPLEYDCNIKKMDADEFKLKNFDINKYMIEGESGECNIFNYYMRYDENDKKGLYDFLEEHTEQSMYSDLRAIRYNFKNFRDGVEIITGEKQSEQSQSVDTEDKRFEQYYTGWKQLNVESISGRVMYKETDDGRYQIEMLGVDEENVDKILSMVREQKRSKDTKKGVSDKGVSM